MLPCGGGSEAGFTLSVAVMVTVVAADDDDDDVGRELVVMELIELLFCFRSWQSST